MLDCNFWKKLIRIFKTLCVDTILLSTYGSNPWGTYVDEFIFSRAAGRCFTRNWHSLQEFYKILIFNLCGVIHTLCPHVPGWFTGFWKYLYSSLETVIKRCQRAFPQYGFSFPMFGSLAKTPGLQDAPLLKIFRFLVFFKNSSVSLPHWILVNVCCLYLDSVVAPESTFINHWNDHQKVFHRNMYSTKTSSTMQFFSTCGWNS